MTTPLDAQHTQTVERSDAPETAAVNDGGPAFPLQSIGPEFAPGFAGMSLRDYFAAQALAGSIAGEADGTLPREGNETIEEALARDAKRRAEWCYAQADAMLRARAPVSA